MRNLGSLLSITMLTIIASLSPCAGASSFVANHVRLYVSLDSAVKPGATSWVAIRQMIEPGWHTYWRNPGDTGLATSVSWRLPAGVSAGALRWPAPEQFATGPVINYGYKGDVAFLVPLTMSRGAILGAAPAHLSIFLLECAQMCIPEQVSLDLDLRYPSGLPGIFERARAAMPKFFAGDAKFARDPAGLTVTLRNPVFRGADAATLHVFPATVRAVNNDVPPRVRIIGDTMIWHAAWAPDSKPFTAFEGVLVVPRAGNFLISARPAIGVPSPLVHADDVTLAGAAVLAFLGGLILNLMPCVLPILSMKALTLAGSAGAKHKLRRDAVFYFAGVMMTFAGIAGSLLLLKSGTAAIGWGYQLQSPLVVFALAMLMGTIGLNLLGAFELPMSLTGVGQELTSTKGAQGAFFTGALAVLVASPCTAPFMSTAMGYAVTQPSASAMTVFMALGMGFAFPFSALAFSPALVRLIPKSGPWTLRLKEFLAFPMFGTAIWLFWVLNLQVGPAGSAIALSVALGVAFTLWTLHHLSSWYRPVAGVVGIASLVALSTHISPPSRSDAWSPWSPEAVAGARLAGKPVLVDFSAAWCVTCLINERVALSDPNVVARLHRDGVVTLKGDWTSNSAAIRTELARYERAGVPLYLLYRSDGQSPPIILPQVLTPASVLEALREMEAQPRS